MEGKKSTDKWFPVIFVDENNYKTPETGKIFSDVTVKYSFEGATSASTATILVADWSEVGEGNYWVQIGNPEFANEGKYQVEVQCSGCYTYRFPVEVTDKTFAEVINDVDSILTDTNETQTKLPTNNIMGSSDKDNHDTDIDAILADTNEMQGKLPTNNIMGSSDKDNHDTDIDAILVDTNEIQGKLPTNNIMGSSVKTDKDDEIDAILVDTNEMQGKLPTNNIMGSSDKTDKDDDIDAILVDTNEIQGKLPTNNIMGSSVKTDKDDEIDSIKSTVDTNLDATVSSRAVPDDNMNLADNAITASKYDESTAFPVTSVDTGSTRIARTGTDGDTLETISDQVDGVQTSVNGIQNNTTFVASVPISMLIPDTGSTMYKLVVHHYDTAGEMEDPDGVVVDSGTTTATSANKLIQAGQNFTSTVKTGMRVDNTTDATFATVVTVDSDISLTLDADIMISGDNYNISDPEIDVLYSDVSGVDKDAFFDNSAGTVSATTGGIDANMWKMLRTDVGAFETYYKLPSTESQSQWTVLFKLVEQSKLLQYSRSTNVVDENPGSVTLADNNTNKDIVASSLKVRDVSGSSAVSGSVYDDIMTNVDAVQVDVTAVLADTNETQAKLPTNNIMGSSDKSDKDDDIDAILVDTNEIQGKLPTNEIMGSSDKADYNDNITTIETTTAAIAANVTLVAAVPSQAFIPSVGNNIIEIGAHVFNTSGSMEDPDNFEVAISLTSAGGPAKTNLFDDFGLTTPATASTTFPGSYKTVRQGLGLYRIFYAIPSSESVDNWAVHFSLAENATVLKWHYVMSIVDAASVSGSVTLSDTGTNKDIIAESLKSRDVSTIPAVTGSVYDDVMDNIDANETKIDAVQSDVTTILADTNEIQIKLPTNNIMGSSDKTDHDDEIANILVDTNEMQGKLPTNNIMGSSDTADHDTDIDAILVDTNEMQGKLPTNNIMGSSDTADHDTDIDAILVDTNEIQGKLPTNEIMGSSDKADHDGEIGDILTDTNEIQGKLPTNEIMGSSDKADYNDNITNIESLIGTPVALDGGSATLGSMLTKLADDNNGADFDATTDSQKAIADAIAKLTPINNLATGQALNSGTVIVGDYTDTHAINTTYFTLSPNGSNTINVDLVFTIAVGQTALKLLVNGRYQATAPTASKYVDIYIYNHNTAGFDKLTGTSSRFNHSTVDEARAFYLLPEHINPASPYDATIRFISSDTNVASRLYLDYLDVVTVSTVSVTPAEISTAVWATRLTDLEDQLSAGGILRSSGGLVFAEIIAVSDAKTFQLSVTPPGGVGAVWQDHVLVFHDISTGQYQCIPIETADGSGNVTLYRNLSVTPVIDDQIAILNETMTKSMAAVLITDIAGATWDELRSAHSSTPGSFGEGIASVQGNVTGNVEGNVEGTVAELGAQAKLDVNAEVDQALTDYDAPTKAELDAAVVSIKGADGDDLKDLSDQLDMVQVSIDGISNVTRLSVALPVYMQRPDTGSKPILVELALKDLDGNMEDPDGNQMALTVYNSVGTNRNVNLYKDASFSAALDLGTGTFVGYRQLERNAVGLYFFYYELTSIATEEELIFKFGWEESSVALYEFRSSQVTDAAGDISQIATDVTAVKGQTDKIRFDVADRIISDAEAISASTTAADRVEANIAKLDVNVSTRSSHTAAQAGTDAASKILSTPANLLDTDASGRVEISGTKNTLDTLQDISVSDILSGNVDGKTVESVLEVVLAYSQGKITKSGSNYTYFKQDNATSLFTLTATPTNRTRS